jgi:ribosomal protein S24E
MAGDSAVVVKTRKFKKNPLLARKQVIANACFVLQQPSIVS